MKETKQDWQSPPVVIAGGGPVGIIVALEMARLGARSLLIDRSPTPTKFPKMDITNGRSMELFRRLGFADTLRSRGVAPGYSFDCLFAFPDGDEPFGIWRQPSVDEQRATMARMNDGSQPLEPDLRVAQSVFEQLGRELCRASPLIDFREGWGFVSLSEDADGVDVTIEETASGTSETIRAAYLVGADGAGSQVRRQLGIALLGDGDLARNYMIHFRSTDYDALHRYGQFWHYFIPGCVLIAQDEVDQWTFHAQLIDPPPDDWAPDPASLIAERLGFHVRIDEVLLTSLWSPRYRLAERYSEGRIFLAGDAAHQVFPVGGYGMNTGVGDAIDIGWKLAAVVNGWGGPSLLASYDAERRPVGAANRDASLRHLSVHMTVGKMASERSSRATLRDYVNANMGENSFDGIEFGYRYTTSPVVIHEQGTPPEWLFDRYVPSTWPGARAPSVILSDGTPLFDRLGPAMTLVGFTGDGAALVEAAGKRGIPMQHLLIAEPAVRRVWERDLVLVRPDEHVAWRSDQVPEANEWERILDRVCGLTQ